MNTTNLSPPRIEQERRAVAITVKTIDEYLQSAYDKAMAANAPGEAVTAAMALAQLHGLIPPMERRVEVVQICPTCSRLTQSSNRALA